MAAAGGKGPTALGLGKGRRVTAPSSDAADDSAMQQQQQQQQEGGAEGVSADMDSGADPVDESGGGMLSMQVDEQSASLSIPSLSSQSSLGGGGPGGGGASHKRKKKGAVGQKRAGIVGAAAASAAAKAERKAGGPLDGAVDAASSSPVPAPRGGNVQPGHGGTRKRKQKEVSQPAQHTSTQHSTAQRSTVQLSSARSSSSSSRQRCPARPAIGWLLLLAGWLCAYLSFPSFHLCCVGLTVDFGRRKWWWSRTTCSLCCLWA